MIDEKLILQITFLITARFFSVSKTKPTVRIRDFLIIKYFKSKFFVQHRQGFFSSSSSTNFAAVLSLTLGSIVLSKIFASSDKNAENPFPVLTEIWNIWPDFILCFSAKCCAFSGCTSTSDAVQSILFPTKNNFALPQYRRDSSNQTPKQCKEVDSVTSYIKIIALLLR